MIHRLASNITDFFVEKNIVEESEREIYIYGFDLLISGVMNVLLVIFVGLVVGKLWQSLLFVSIMITVRIISYVVVVSVLFLTFWGKYVTVKADDEDTYEEIIEQYYEYANLGNGEDVVSLYSDELAEYTNDFFVDISNKTAKNGIFNITQADVIAITDMSSYETFVYKGNSYTDVKLFFVKCDMEVNQSDKYYMEGINYFVFYIGKSDGNSVIFNIEIPSYSTICEYESNVLVANSYQADRNYYLYGIEDNSLTRSDNPVYVDVVANPSMVRVYVSTTGTIDTVSFSTYLRRTAAVELNSGLASEDGYIAAAMAAKMFAIHKVLTAASGANYDIHSVNDQGYSATEPISDNAASAVNTALNYFLLDYYGAVFPTFYRTRVSDSDYCVQYGGILPQIEASQAGQYNCISWQDILEYYYTKVAGYSYYNSRMNEGPLIITTAHTHDFSDPSGCPGCGAVPY